MPSIRDRFKNIIFFALELCVIFGVFLIAIYVITGGFTYSHLNIASSYFEIHDFLRPSAVVLILIIIIEILKRFWKTRERPYAFELPIYYFISFLCIYAAIIIPSVLFRYYSFDFPYPVDIALYNQAVYNTVHGHPLATTCFGYLFHNWNQLADHVSLILLLLAPLYYFFQSPETLLVIQAVIIILGAVPVYCIAGDVLKNRWMGFAISAIYLLWPLTARFYIYEIRFEYFAMVFFLFAFLFLKKKKTGFFVLFTILALLCKENIFITVSILGFYVFLFERDIKRHRAVGLLIILFGVLYGVFIIMYLMPALSRYSVSGFSAFCSSIQPIKDIRNFPLNLFCAAKENFRDVFFLLFQEIRALGLIPFLSPFLFLSVGNFLENVYFGYQYAVEVWHKALYVPFIFISFIYVVRYLGSLSKRLKKYAFLYRFFYIWAIGLPLLIGGINFNRGILDIFIKNRLHESYKTELYSLFEEAVRYIPKKGSLISQVRLSDKVSSREEFYLCFVYKNVLKEENPDCIIFSDKVPYNSDDEHMYFCNIAKSGNYLAVYDRNGFKVLVNKDKVNKKVKSVFDFSRKEFITGLNFNPCNSEYALRREYGGLCLSLYFDGSKEEDEFLQIRLKRGEPIYIEENDYLELNYRLEDKDTQFIEIVLGIDMNGDNKVDDYITRLYPEPAEDNIYLKYNLAVYDLVKRRYPQADNFQIIEIEVYPHKKWRVDCTGRRRKRWYKFWIKDLKFFNLVLKDK